jgi:hypothetical protein
MTNEITRNLGRLVVKQFDHARVYVDGRFAGYSDEMNSLARGMEIEEGAHDLVIVGAATAPRSLQVRVWAGAAALVLPGLVLTVRS